MPHKCNSWETLTPSCAHVPDDTSGRNQLSLAILCRGRREGPGRLLSPLSRSQFHNENCPHSSRPELGGELTRVLANEGTMTSARPPLYLNDEESRSGSGQTWAVHGLSPPQCLCNAKGGLRGIGEWPP